MIRCQEPKLSDGLQEVYLSRKGKLKKSKDYIMAKKKQ